jgi:hypothetical protein
MRFRNVLIAIAAIAALVLAVPGIASADHANGSRSYEVTIENLTAGQILTPPVFAAHRGSVSLFEPGRPASTWVKEIAENGNVEPLAQSLDVTEGVATSGVAVSDANGAGPILAGQSRTWTFDAPARARHLSTVSMVVCTNDGFTGLDGLRLPNGKDRSIEVYVYAYDAGTEQNTEAFDDLVPPCSGGASGSGVSNPALFENGVVTMHEGLTGAGDLDLATWGWDGPVARFTITRVS